jgi:hypothetical protein
MKVLTRSQQTNRDIDEKKDLIDIRLNRVDRDYVLNRVKDLDFGYERTIETSFFSHRAKISKRPICGRTVAVIWIRIENSPDSPIHS